MENRDKSDPPPKPSKKANARAEKGRSSSRSPGGGVPFDDALAIPRLSATVRSALQRSVGFAHEQEFSGLIGSGIMLATLVRMGADRKQDPLHAPRFLHDLIQRHVGGGFDEAVRRFLDENRREAGGVPSDPPGLISSNLWRVLQRASELRRRGGYLAARHLIVALLLFRPGVPQAASSAAALLSNAGLHRDVVLGEFLQSLATRGPEEERDAWAKLAAEHPVPPPSPGPDAPPPPRPRGPIIAGYHADTPSGRAADDCLGLDSSVSAMANLIASTQLDGTLSLGVFGNWGSGKSFFMKRLRDEIDAIAKVARGVHAPNEVPAYWSNIAQVEFNAWHYVDANLWASLMSHLLDVLRRWDPSGGLPKADSPIAQAIEKLEIAASARLDAEARQEKAEKAQRIAVAALNRAKSNYAGATEKLSRLVARSVWSFVEGRITDERQRATEALEKLELVEKGAQTSVETLYAQVRDVVSTAGRLHTIAHGMLRDGDGAKHVVYLTLGVLAAAVVIAIALVWVGVLHDAAAVVCAAIVGCATALGKAFLWVQQTANAVHKQLAPLRAARASIEQKLGEAENEKAARIAEAEKGVAMAQTRVEAAAAEVAAREQELREAERALVDAVSGRAVRQFIEQRLATGDYQKHLGLIAMIRRDFEQLGELIRAHNCSRRRLKTEMEQIRTALLRARPQLKDEDLLAMFENIGINRIVLYIDDLDRCPSSRVVEVLQAIHLLVSFPIFVVVVGVDSRWMAHSLAREYPALLVHTQGDDSARAAGSREEARALVTPADYLEKIFQIPFWVPPLRTSSAQKLIGKLTEAPAGGMPFGTDTGGGEREQAQDTGGELLEGEPAADISAPWGVDGAEGSGQGAGRSGPAGLRRDREKEEEETQKKQKQKQKQEQEQEHEDETSPPPSMRPDLLRVAEGERISMQSLAALIGRSPRATKRFVNSYRLLKVALVMQEPGRFTRDSEAVGHLSGPMFLLAVVVGLPTLAGELMGMLPANPDVGVVDQLEALARWAGDDPQHAFAVQRIREFTSSADAARWRTLRGTDLRPWVTRVGQFSFEDMHA